MLYKNNGSSLLPNIQRAYLTTAMSLFVKQFNIQHKRCQCALRLVRCHLTASVQEKERKREAYLGGVRQKEITAHGWWQDFFEKFKQVCKGETKQNC